MQPKNDKTQLDSELKLTWLKWQTQTVAFLVSFEVSTLPLVSIKGEAPSPTTQSVVGDLTHESLKKKTPHDAYGNLNHYFEGMRILEVSK